MSLLFQGHTYALANVNQANELFIFNCAKPRRTGIRNKRKLLNNYSEHGNEPWRSGNRLCYVAHSQGVIKKQGQ